MVEALADGSKEFIFDGGPLWRPEKALDAANREGWENQVAAIHNGLLAAMTPATRLWIGQRLASFFVLFHPTRDVDDRAFTIWNDETTRLLIDLPHDILGQAIDDAIRNSAHGFMPSVGEIRQQARPLVEERRQHIERLHQMEAALLDPVATEARKQRRFDIEANERRIAQDEQRAREREAREAEERANTPTPSPSNAEGVRRWR